MKSLEGAELHQDADEKSPSQADLFSALRFKDSRNKIDKSPPPYILIWIRLLGGWPLIVNGGCRFDLKQGSNLSARLGFWPKLGFLGIMAGSSCVPAPGKYFILLFG